VRVSQSGTDQYVIHQFKDFVGELNEVTLKWEGQTNCPPSLSTMYLQIYNYTTSTWTTIASNNISPFNTDFTLEAFMADLTDYKNASSVITCRVYQLAI
jgi:hypothetical protein